MKKLIYFIVFSSSCFAVDTIKVGLFNVAPFSYANDSGELKGVTYLFLEKLAKESEIKFEYKLLPYQRVVTNLADGEIDMAMLYPSESFTNRFEALGESIGNDNLIVLDEETQGKNLKELANKKIAILRGAKYSEEFDANTSLTRVYVNNYTQALSMFLSGRVNAVVIPKVALNFFIITHKDISQEKFKKSFILNHKHNWLHVRNGFPQKLKQKIIDANKRVIKNNNLKELDDLSLASQVYEQLISSVK